MMLLLMLLTSVSSWAETVNVGYKDADGTTKYVDATVLNNTMNDLAEGWYVVNGDVTYNGDLETNGNGDVNIILCDGATLTANNITPKGHKDRLRIYGQSQGTGTANISGTLAGCYSLSINGGTINANILDGYQGSVGINGGTVNVGRISPYGGVSFNGGNVIVTGDVEARNYGNIILSGGTVKASSYSAIGGYVCISKGLTYYDGTGASYTGTEEHYEGFLNLTSTEIAAIAGKTLRTFDYRGGTCGDPNVNEGKNVTWLLNLNTKTLTISGTGAMANYGGSAVPWEGNKSDITSVLIESGVTTIGNYAFFYCTNLATVTFAAGSQLTSIGIQSFCNTALSTVTIPAGVTDISSYAFSGCEHLASINVEAGNTSFASEGGVLFNYDKTTLVLYPVAKSGTSYEIPSSVTAINDHAFDYCTNLTSITIPDYVTSIGESSFSGTGLTSVIIPASVMSIGSWAFSSCLNLSRVYVLRSTTPLTTLGDGAFDGCPANPVIVVPASADYSSNGNWSNYNLLRGYTVTCADGITATTTNNGPLVEQDETVTLSYTGTATIPAGYCPAYSYNDGSSDHAISGTTFTMPNSNVVVSAVFEAIPWSGTGTSTDPYLIEYASQLDLLATKVNGGTYYVGTYFKLANDITYAHTTAWNAADSQENNFTRIGTGGESFIGTFDGQGHTISGIRIYSSDYCQGLFGDINGGCVRNVILDDARITGQHCVGGIAGISEDGTIENCHVTANVLIGSTGDNPSRHGGIAGCNQGTVDGCTSSATLSQAQECGGIVGCNESERDVVKNCLAMGVTIYGDNFVGAIAGNNTGTLSHNYYSDCTAPGRTYDIGCNGADITDNDGAVEATILSDAATSLPALTAGTKVAFRREFTGGKASTVVFPFAYTPSATEGKYYTFGGVTYDGNKGKWIATMTEYTGTTLSANTPYLFVPAGTEAHKPVLFHGEAATSTSAGTTTNGDWQFKGVYAEKTWAAAACGRDYGFAATSGKATDGVTDVEAGDFVMLAEGAHIKPLRSYLTYTGTDNPWATTNAPAHRASTGDMPASISVVLVSADGSTTSVNEELRMKSEEFLSGESVARNATATGWFTLSGTRLNGKPSAKGLYIHNGLKVVIK